jgi:lycopene beta-cyclase
LSNHYHYIITGAGLSGSSLLIRMIREPFFRDKKILVIDQSPKTENDRTWCFWEKKTGLFEPIVHHRWNSVNFYSKEFSNILTFSPYQYKMIRGIDFYTYIKSETKNHSNIEWRNEKVKSITNTGDTATVTLETETVTGDYIFNSILFKDIQTPLLESGGGYLLLQHFKGFLIQTKEPVFNPSVATFMDFRVSQEHGTTFMYVLPISTTTALVEYTLFTEKLLPEEMYEAALREYIRTFLQISEYTIEHKEFGVIPMTNRQFPLQDGRIVNMGIAGGQVKGSSGYAFQFIQKRTAKIVASLMQNGHPFMERSVNDKKFHLYDSVLLNVLYKRKMNGDEIFALIFQKNPPERILRFLDNESTLWEDLQIMQSVPTRIFLPAAMHELIG